MQLRSLRSRPAAAMLVALAAAAVASIAWAGIPDNDGVIHGCYKNANGALRVIDLDSGGKCNQSETAIEWSEQGPQGEQGQQGEQGLPGPAATKPGFYKTGASLQAVPLRADSNGELVLAIDLPVGSYAITATIVVLSSDIAPAPAALVFCQILGGTGASSSSQTAVGQLGQVTMPIVGARTLPSAGQVTVNCASRPLNVGVPPSQVLVRVGAAILAQAVDPLMSEEPVG